MTQEILFLDIGDILTVEDRRREGNDFDEYKLQLLARILKFTNFNIVWISSWIRNDSVNVIDKYLEERGFKLFDRIIGPICDSQQYRDLDKYQFDAIKINLIEDYIKLFKPNKYLVIDSDQIATSANFLALDRNGLDPLHTVRIIKNYKDGWYNVSN